MSVVILTVRFGFNQLLQGVVEQSDGLWDQQRFKMKESALSL